MEICALHAVGELGLEGKVQEGDAFRCFRGTRERGKVYGGERRVRTLKKKENWYGKSGDSEGKIKN